MQQAVRSAHLIHMRPLLAPHRVPPISLLPLDPLFPVLFGNTHQRSPLALCVLHPMVLSSFYTIMAILFTHRGTLVKRGRSVQTAMAGDLWLAQLMELERLRASGTAAITSST